MRYRFGGLIFEGAYTWRGLFSEFYGISLTEFLSILLLSSGKEDETRQNPSGPDLEAFSNSANKLIFSRTFLTLCTLTFIRTMLCS